MDVKQEKRIDDFWNIDGSRQVSLNLFHWKRNLQTENMVRGEIQEKTAYIQARSFMARTLEENEKECQAEGEAKVVE